MTALAPRGGLGNAERAAVMIMLLEEAQAAQIVGQLGPDELQVLGEKMVALGDIGPEQIAQAIAGFVDNTQQHGIPARGRTQKVQALMHRAVGTVKAESLMQRIMPEGEDGGPALELARWLTPQAQMRANAWMLMSGSLGTIASRYAHTVLPSVTGEWDDMFCLRYF